MWRRNWQELKEALSYAISSCCFSSKHLQQLHALAVAFGLQSNLYITALLITKYCSFGNLEAALQVFKNHNLGPKKTLVWNSLMRGYSRNQRPRSVLDVYYRMTVSRPECEPDKQTFNLVITACTKLSEFELGSIVHCHAQSRGLEFDVLVGTALIGMYCQARDLETARRLFDGMPVRDVVCWNTMITGYTREGFLREVMNLFRNMRFAQGILPTEATMVNSVSVCGEQKTVTDGEIIHAHAVKIGFENNQLVCNSLIQMYIGCRCLNSALTLFNGMLRKDSVTWSTMIGGYVQNGRYSDALDLFHQMILHKQILPTRPILLNVLLACAQSGDVQLGKQIEEDYISSSNEIKSDACVITTLVYMYMKCGKIETSLDLVNRISQETEQVIAWNAMMKACAELGCINQASKVVAEMLRSSIHPNSVTLLTLLPLLSSFSLLREGMEAHAYTIKAGLESDRSVANALIDMYGKCGSIKYSRAIFNRVTDKDVVSWSSIIKSYALNGNGMEALDLFQLMKEEGRMPNDITFTAVLSACRHAGFVKQGKQLFKCMKEDYGLEPAMEHYACMADLFCRAGLLSEAYQLIQNTCMDAHDSVCLWGSLLSACRVHSNCAIGEAAARHLFNLEPKNSANYMMLAQIYISAGRREDAYAVLRLLREKGLRKNPGYSWLDRGNISPPSLRFNHYECISMPGFLDLSF